MPEHPKILYVCQQITPYMPETPAALLARALAQAISERGTDVRTFMPRWGCINERRNQLHEVIRLSGMNLIIGENDHQLIIKVASIPSARLQVYFIDNEEYFARKAVILDEEGRLFPDNDERALFFARGVLETIKKLRWAPDIVHCHGWFSALVPLYLKSTFADDPLFNSLKIVLSLDGEGFDGQLDARFADKLQAEGIAIDRNILPPTYENLMCFVMRYADAITIDTPTPGAALLEAARATGKPVLEYQEGQWDAYQKCYELLLEQNQ